MLKPTILSWRWATRNSEGSRAPGCRTRRTGQARSLTSGRKLAPVAGSTLQVEAEEAQTRSHHANRDVAAGVDALSGPVRERRGRCTFSDGRFKAFNLAGQLAGLGRKSKFAASGTSRRRGLVAEWLNRPQALAPTTVRSRGTADIRPGGRPRSGIGIS